MVAEIDPLERLGNKKSNESALKLDTESPRRNDTATPKTSNNTQVRPDGSTTTTATASDFQPPKPSIVKAPPKEESIVLTQVVATTSQALPTDEESKNASDVFERTKIMTGNKSEIPGTESKPQKPPNASSDSDRDTVDKPNLPLTMMSSSPAIEKVQTISAIADLAASSVKGAAKRVTFTGTPQTQPISNDLALRQASSSAPSSQSSVARARAPTTQKRHMDQISAGAPLTASTPVHRISVIDSTSKVDDSTHGIEDEKLKARLPLVEPYGSFILPSDTCLADARKRLRTALNQSRHLRSAFTERVYEKYKVILRPVPPTDQIVDKISSDPVGMNAKLQEEVRVIKEEKDLEKKDAQKLAATGLFSSGDGKHPTASQAPETADQLAYVGAGLNLVILPEEDAQNSGVDMGKYQYRGPVNPETGQRNGGISAAAATAAEILLDRVRRSTIMRAERVRRAKDGSTDTVPSPASMLSRYHFMTSSIAPPSGHKSTERRSHQMAPPPPPPPIKNNRKGSTKVSSGSLSSGKSGRGRSQPTVSGSTMLSLIPLVEDIDEDRKPTASTSALLSRGVGSKAAQQRWLHPHPESLAGRKLAIAPGARRADFPGNGLDLEGVVGSLSLDLPPLPKLSSHAKRRTFPVHDRRKVTSPRAKRALQSILAQFESSSATNRELDQSKSGKRDDGASCETKAPVASSQQNRRATEIGLMRGMQRASDVEGKNDAAAALHTAELSDVKGTISARAGLPTQPAEQNGVEPIVAFSVLQALGLIHDTPSPHKEPTVSVAQRLLRINPVLDSLAAPTTWCSSETVEIYGKIASKKRSFTQAFASDFSCSVEQTTTRHQGSRLSTMPRIGAKGTIAAGMSLGGRANGGSKTSLLDVAVEREGKGGDCPVVEIRGGGGDEVGSEATKAQHQRKRAVVSGSGDNCIQRVGDDAQNVEATRRPKSAPHRSSGMSPNRLTRPSSSSSAPISFSQSMRASSADGLFSVLSQNRANPGGPVGGGFSQQGNAAFGLTAGAAGHRGVADRIQAQAHQLHLQAAAMNRLSPAGDLADFFGPGLHRRQGYAGHAEWAALGASSQAAVNLLPSHSLTALGINPHQAAMLELSARDRATRALFAREQQAAVHAAAVHRQASAAIRSGAGVPSLSTQQAAALMNAQAQARAGLLSASPVARFGQLGAHSAATAAAILSSPAAAAYVGQSPLSAGVMSGHLPPVQHSDSRPSSRHSTSSTASNKGKRQTTSKGRKESKESVGANKLGVSVSGTTSKEESKDAPSSNKRKSAEVTKRCATNTDTNEPKTKKPAIESAEAKNLERCSPVPASSPNRTKASSTTIEAGKEPKLHVGVLDPRVLIGKSEKVVAMKQPPYSTEPQNDASPKREDSTSPPPATAGMQFFLPPVPPNLDAQTASFVLDGRVHIPLGKMFLPSGELRSVSLATALLDFLQAVGSSVPIPKALLNHPLKERLNLQTLKSSSNGGQVPSVPREIVLATILVWLWVQHKDSFQRAFAKSGRIDVDPECKWLIQAAIDATSRALMSELSEAMQNGGPLAAAMSSARNKGGSASSKSGTGEPEKQASASANVDARVALIVNEALMSELCIDEEVDKVIPEFHNLVELLDETRMNALRAKCRERVMLAAAVSKYATMSESFSHAYVSSMVRAGEALGHGDLFEWVQDEETSSSTMIPYDIFSDELGAWEDPCRPLQGFTPSLTGEDLVRRAHARGMIMKSLRKMQDRNNLKGGTASAGPYAQPSQGQSPNPAGHDGRNPHRTSTGGLSRRKSSLSLPEPSVQPGTGSARATSSTQYHPRHACTPLFWDSFSIERMPYGKHSQNSRPRALSINSLAMGKEVSKDGRKRGRGRSSAAISPAPTEVEVHCPDGVLQRSTEEVNWTEVANVFQNVNSEGRSKRRSLKTAPQEMSHTNPVSKTIIAPFCRRLDKPVPAGGDSDSEQEDLNDETMLARHKVVLDQMKERLDKFMEGRTTAGQRARQRAQARAAEKAALDSGDISSALK